MTNQLLFSGSSHYLYKVSEARVFALFVLDKLQCLTLLTAQVRHLLLKLLSCGTFKLTHAQQHDSSVFLSVTLLY